MAEILLEGFGFEGLGSLCVVFVRFERVLALRDSGKGVSLLGVTALGQGLTGC